jgi:hypothetical protein
MITCWYITAQPEENWRSVSNLFGEWLDANALLQSFGYSEGDTIEHHGITLLCFKFPAQHGEKISLFPKWANAIGRIHGGAEHGSVQLSNGQVVALPPEPVQQVPSWLR